MRFASPIRIAVAAAVALVAPSAFFACDLVPLPSPEGAAAGGTTGSTGGSGGAGAATSTSSGGTSGSGGSGAATSTSSGGSGGSGATTASSGGSGGATTTSSGGTAGSGATSSSTGGSGGAGGATTGSGAGGSGGAGGAITDGGVPDDASDGGDASACRVAEATFTPDLSPHVAQCSAVTYSTNPPTSGPHYGYWASFKTYTSPVPRGFYVHSMEHGAVVVEYNCPSGCAAEVDAIVAYLDSRPADPLCVAPVKNRFIVTPDPLLDVPIAASAWGASLKMQCLDLAALGAFIDAHYAKAPENFCSDLFFDPTSPDAGVPGDCGEPMDAGSD